MEEIRETDARRQGGARLKKGGKGPLIALGVVLAVLAAAYLGVCAYAGSLETFYPNTTINGVDVGGQTPGQAGETLRTSIPKQTLAFCLPLTDGAGGGAAPEGELLYGDAPACTRTYEDLGITGDLDYGASAQFVFDLSQGAPGFLADGWYFLKTLVGGHGAKGILLDPEEHILTQQMQQLAEDFSREPMDTAHAVAESGLEITMAQNGLAVSATELTEETRTALREGHSQVLVAGTILPARSLTAQELYDQVSGEVKNAGYDAKTGSIVPEQIGAEFDVTTAQAAMDAAAPGETVTIPAQVELPAVTTEQLQAVLFRDVLGEARTKVGGTSARKSNVRLSAAAINGFVMNTGDVFSYNGVVGQRTAANGYQAAPAYVKGETVDEIGGGICQTSSTLYLACLRSNLEITERYAHRYIPAYITAGMDATVSWGGPDYKFTNDTNYPIKIVTSYEGSYLTVKILGTNIAGTRVKMTNEHLSSTPFEVVYEDDPTLPAGTEQVKTTPYTGHKYRTYRNVYDADGKLLSSEYEATSDYKSRNKVILRGPAPEVPVTPENPDVPAQGSGELPADPSQPPKDPGTLPADPGVTPPADPAEPPPIIVVEPETAGQSA
jgi:vancomycin resistance protein YoaR